MEVNEWTPINDSLIAKDSPCWIETTNGVKYLAVFDGFDCFSVAASTVDVVWVENVSLVKQIKDER